MVDLTDRLHFLRSLDRLSIIDNQQTVVTALFLQSLERRQGLLLNENRLIELTSPEKLTVIGSMGNVSQELDQPVVGTAVTDANGNDEIAIIRIDVSRHLVVDRPENRFDFLRNFSDSNHKASLPVNIGFHSVHRLEKAFFVGSFYP